MRKKIEENIKHIYDGCEFVYTISKHLGIVQFYTRTSEFNFKTGQIEHNDVPAHSVAFTPVEQMHIAKGGTVAIIHACGTELHVTMPKWLHQG